MAIGTINPLAIKSPGQVASTTPLWAPPSPPSPPPHPKLLAPGRRWVQVGSTDEGLTYAESTDTEDIRVAESLYAVRTVTTSKTGTVSLSLSEIHDSELETGVERRHHRHHSGTGATKLNTFVPPLAGSEVRVMLGLPVRRR